MKFSKVMKYLCFLIIVEFHYVANTQIDNSPYDEHPDIVCCECVPFYLCINDTIITDGSGVLDLRIGGQQQTNLPSVNVKLCSDVSQVCCQVPDPNPICLNQSLAVSKEKEELLTPDPNSLCECIPYKECDPQLVVSDGLGSTTIELSNGRLVSHSRCQHSLDVCCYLPNLLLRNSSDPVDENNDCECVDPSLCGPDGHIQVHGIGVISLRFGSPSPRIICPYDPTLVCCLPPKTSSTHSPISHETTSLTLNDEPITQCECVIPALCGNDGHIKTDGVGLIDLRIGPSNPPKKCPHDPELVCCLPPKTSSTHSPISHETTSLTLNDEPITQCECVIPALCGQDGHIKTDGVGLIDLRIGPSNPPKRCPHDPELVCCLPPKNEIQSTTQESAVNAVSTVDLDEFCQCVKPNLCAADGFVITNEENRKNVRPNSEKFLKQCSHDPSLVCCRSRKHKHTPSKEPPGGSIPNSPCGLRNYNGIGVRILGFNGGQTQFGEFPWVASILKDEKINGNKYTLFVGGASLIHPRVVLTAAHKVSKNSPNELFVRLGEWDTSSTKEILPYQDISVQEKIIHPKYVAGPLFHDIALLVLKDEAKNAFHINPICIAKSLEEIVPTGCVTNGWGVDRFRSENYQEIMKSVTLPLVNKKICQNLLRKTRLSRHFQLHYSFLCAGGEKGIDSCEGDGGGPLACPKKNNTSQYLQVGITAWGIGCGVENVPGVYVDVPVHYNWVSNEITTRFPEEKPVHT